MLIYLIALPFLFLLSFKSKYRVSIPARFFLWKNPPLEKDGIWFHTCSYGEAKAIKPLVDALPKTLLRMTTTTHTGKSVIESYTPQSRYLPFEPLLFGWLRPQKALVVMEAEFWYLLFVLAKRRGAKTLLVNARMNDRSFPKYLKMRWFYRQIFASIDAVYAQTQTDKERLEALGADHVTVTGNIKLASLPKVTRRLVKPNGMLLCAASTHEGEEMLVLEAFVALKKEMPDAKLAVVPRHPERFGKVAALLEAFAQRNQMQWHCFSDDMSLEDDIVLIDRMGELVNLYAVSDMVILGGAFVPVGGHNAAEAAQFGCKIISGPHYFNQKDIFEAVEGIAVVEPANLTRRVLQYAQLKPARLKTKTDMTPILEQLNNVL
ncbi:Lipid IVA 3-deoxy-D-manno-octulosonic acid transferase [often with also] [hydrothermal vent metagenome]|uniref:Lipid IVA 3-deoxy-D-manno-octulosonic acid transferase [often with also] n=1 Tax=hydrothermal vent metagenome TaxID=652676 RepID=A0A1W1E8K7_9ZZZZ